MSKNVARISPPLDHRRRPRRKRPPHPRDFAIQQAYRQHRQSQQSLARQYGLSQSRTSAIIRRVERWLAETGCHSSFAPAQPQLSTPNAACHGGVDALNPLLTIVQIVGGGF